MFCMKYESLGGYYIYVAAELIGEFGWGMAYVLIEVEQLTNINPEKRVNLI